MDLYKRKLDNIPDFFFKNINKNKFLEFCEEIFVNIENIEEINFNASLSFIKLKFLKNNINFNDIIFMIKNQCKQ